jgi:Tol biopolymer transport system component
MVAIAATTRPVRAAQDDEMRVVFYGYVRNVMDVRSLRAGAEVSPDGTRWAPDWSPAGDRIAFTSCDQKLYVVNADGTGVTPMAASAYAPRWSVDGKSLLLLSGRMLLRIRADGGPVQRVGVLPYHGGPFSVGPIH